jgi:hypothetical protein
LLARSSLTVDQLPVDDLERPGAYTQGHVIAAQLGASRDE